MTARLALASAALWLTACGTYELRGKVIEGPASRIEFVDASEPRLAAAGLEGATFELSLDPQRPGRKRIATGNVGADGTFSIPVKELGAGFLEYDFGLVFRLPGHDSAVEYFRLPGRHKRLLVTLARGPDRYSPPLDPAGDLQQFSPR